MLYLRCIKQGKASLIPRFSLSSQANMMHDL